MVTTMTHTEHVGIGCTHTLTFPDLALPEFSFVSTEPTCTIMCIMIVESCMLYCMQIQYSSCIHAQSALNTGWWRLPSCQVFILFVYCFLCFKKLFSCQVSARCQRLVVGISNVAGSHTVADIIHHAQLLLAAVVLSGNAACTAADDWHDAMIAIGLHLQLR